MLEGFDELYNKFFDNKNKLNKLIDELINKMENKKNLDELINSLNNFEEIKECEFGGNIEPDEIINIKVIKLKEKPLEIQLDEAIINEEYEKAADIRDLISKRDSKIKKNKKNK